jgi:hypothetical protein
MVVHQGPYKDKALGNGQSLLFRQLLTRKSLCSGPSLIAISFSVALLLSLLLLSQISHRDPTSYFFDPKSAYEKGYSISRLEQARAFISNANATSPPKHDSLDYPLLCVGVATVARRGEQYVGDTVGSLLEGLSTDERNSIFLNILFGHTEPSQHPLYAEPWVSTLPDRVLQYQEGTNMFDQLTAWEKSGQYRNKTIYDYTYLLKNCYETQAPYIAMIEDDTIAVRGWYNRAMSAAEQVQTSMETKQPQKKWMYLRLFYADDLLGWNSESWRTYLFWSFCFWASSTALLFGLRRRYRKLMGGFSDAMLAVVSAFCLPALIILFFMAGRHTMLPLKSGVQQMNQYGCCSQGFIFPRSVVPHILAHADLQTDWLVDMMLEQLADREGWIRWVVVPSLLQHIGATSSKGYGFDDSARRLWSFRFEEYAADP